ncbi:hypothetical protein [Sphingobacterium composti Ten et al. 2007 non Yoo et al. 2007]|uniref:hypothetical protein n=1 Tax=Sphingobacterium composti TaxID=363260 RepID=UPI0013572F4F|nr:hypothetical protein [Sphingobacterium composti Ten et al. 2007 non Yoo et al. 2007]
MQQSITHKHLIYDPYSPCGYYLAKILIAKGHQVMLLSNQEYVNTRYAEEDLDNRSFEYYDIKNSCDSNLFKILSKEDFSEFIYIKSMLSSAFIFESSYSFENEIKQKEIRLLLDSFASENNIEIVEHRAFHCNKEVMEGIINRIGDFLLDKNKRLYVNLLDLNIIFCADNEYVNILDDIIEKYNERNHLFIPNVISLRDIFKVICEELGAELEFCGKGEHERGVIVDYDEDFLTDRNIDIPKIRLGNTLIKINDGNYAFTSANITKNINNSYVSELQLDDFKKLRNLIKSLLYPFF